MRQPADDSHASAEWFAAPRDDQPAGLRFSCTMCGNCCSGPAGYVLVSDDEAAALARRLGLTVEKFLAQYTNVGTEGRSLNEKKSAGGLDCVFLDRESMPGKAICGVYEDRPAQCRTWPFWPSNLKSQSSWERAKRTCPGMDQGKLHPPQKIRIMRDSFKI